MIHFSAGLRWCAVVFFLLRPIHAENVVEKRGEWAPFVEGDFPFFSSVLDLRRAGATNNITPRGIVLNAGHGFWACFDTELLRVSAVWKGSGVTPVSMSQGSYFLPGVKAPEGQGKLPAPDGELWLWNGVYPGWQTDAEIALADPRKPGPDPREVGRGPLPASAGRFRAVRTTEPAVLDYEVEGAAISETVTAADEGFARNFEVAPHEKALWLLLGKTGHALTADGATKGLSITQVRPGIFAVRVPASSNPVRFSVALGTKPPIHLPRPIVRWPQTVETSATLSTNLDAYVTDNIELPLRNPWKRNVRIADIAFFRDGRAAAVTFDGDVWMITGLHDDLARIRWRRFTSGLHEPLAIAIRDDELFVFDRNGIWRLRDTNADGEADVHELFSNAFTQTAETREFASGMRAAPDGSFVISKGGQESATVGRHNGSILRISPDGLSVTVLGHGLRQPFLGVHPRTGIVTASDQQGHYIPSTPLHILHGNAYYGFIPTFLPKERYPESITEPLTWIPHPVNPSGASQVWLTDARMGPLNGALLHLGYYRPEVFLVLLNSRAERMQAAVVSLTRDLQFPPLAGAMNPVDGQAYLAGFQIWGTTARQISGLARLRYTGRASTLPREIVPMDKGVLLRFSEPLPAGAATNPARFSAERWNYRRSAEYGSPHYRLDGAKGQEALPVSSAYLSWDRKAVFIGIPDMKPVMQMRLGWTMGEFRQNAYFTIYELPRFVPAEEGFAPIEVDLASRGHIDMQQTPVTVEEGQRLSELMGCVACHSTDGSVLGKVAPTWKGLYGRERRFAGGAKTRADEAYLRESIREPAAKVVSGFEKTDAGMPSYQGVLTPDQIEALVLYIKSLSPQ